MTANSANTGRMIGYLTKYLTKSLDACHTTRSDAQRRHVDRLAEALRHEPCSPTCANWLRYGVQPKNAKPGFVPGQCRGKAHRRETLGFGGRRVLVSRKWSGKTLRDHKADRVAFIRQQLEALGQTGTGPAAEHDPSRTAWTLLRLGDPTAPRREHLLLHAAQRRAWRAQFDAARLLATGPPPDVPATAPAASAASPAHRAA